VIAWATQTRKVASSCHGLEGAIPDAIKTYNWLNQITLLSGSRSLSGIRYDNDFQRAAGDHKGAPCMVEGLFLPSLFISDHPSLLN